MSGGSGSPPGKCSSLLVAGMWYSEVTQIKKLLQTKLFIELVGQNVSLPRFETVSPQNISQL